MSRIERLLSRCARANSYLRAVRSQSDNIPMIQESILELQDNLNKLKGESNVEPVLDTLEEGVYAVEKFVSLIKSSVRDRRSVAGVSRSRK